MLADDLRWALDPAAWAAEVLGWVPDATQADMLQHVERQALACCTRQWGKTQTCATKVAHRALYLGGLTVIVSPSGRQSGEMLARVRDVLKRADAGPLVGDGINEHSVVLPSGARVVGLPCDHRSNRGFSDVGLLVVEEAAYILDDEDYHAIGAFQTICTRPPRERWMISTPYGKRGFFYDAWRAVDGSQRVMVRAEDCPRISREWLDAERARLGARAFSQEYGCEFLDGGGAAVDASRLAGLVRVGLAPLFGGGVR